MNMTNFPKVPSGNNMYNGDLSGFAASAADLYFWEWNVLEHRIVLSEDFIEMLGYTDKDFDPSIPTIYKNIHPDDIEPNLEKVKELIKGKIPLYEFEYRLMDAEGEWKWFYNRGRIIEKDKDGNPTRIGGIAMDISSRFRGVLRRIEEDRKFEFIFKNIAEPVLIIRFNNGSPDEIIDLNQAAADLFAYRLEEMLGMNPFNFRTGTATNIEEVVEDLREGKQIHLETRIIDRNGNYHAVDIRAFSYQMGKESLVITVIRDLTDDLETREKLQQSEIRFESLFRNAPMGIAMLEPDGHIMLANSAFINLIPGFPEGKAGQRIFDHLELGDKSLSVCMERILAGKEVVCIHTMAVQRGERKQWYSITVSPVKGKDGSVDYLIFTLRDITAQKEIENSLKESEKLYRTLIESAEDRIGLFRMDQSPVFMNNAFANALGFSVDEYMDVDEMARIHPHDRKALLAREEEFLKTGYMSNEYRIMHRDGHYLCMYSKMVIIRGETREDDHILSIVRDVTERQSTIRRLKQSEMQYKQLLEAIPDNILQVNREGRVLESNFMTETSRRSQGGRQKGKDLDDVYPKEVARMAVKEVARVLDSRKSVVFEHETLQEKDKKYFETRIIFLTSGEVLMIIRDLTFRKLSDIAVRESETKYRTLVEAADDRIALYDGKGKRVLKNSAYYTQLGYSDEEYEALPYGSLLHPDDQYLFKGKGLPLHLIGTRPQVVIEYRMQHRTGHFMDMMAKIVPVQDTDGAITGYLEIVRDITPLKKVEQQLRIAKEKAEESDLLKSAFLANMSHEIRTPMNSIVGFANLLTNASLDEESRKEYVRRINRNSEQLLALISDIIDLAKIESRQLSIIRSRVMLGQVMQELYDQFQQEIVRIGKPGIRLILDSDKKGEDVIIHTDHVRLTQVFQNLLNNAIKFTQEGEIRFGYRLSPKNRVLLFVADTGIGIARENYEIIFDQFRQVDGSQTRKFGGTGLGLAICRNLVRMMGGKIWVESELGKGAIFYIDLPLGDISLVHAQLELAGKVPAGGKDYSGYKVIVVDDNLDTQVFFMGLFKEIGLTPQVAGCSEDLLGLIRAGSQPDLVLLDIQLPDVGGEDILPVLRDLIPGTAVIAQSAFALAGDRERFVRSGFDGYIAKPFGKEDITAVLDSLISKD